MNTRSTEDRIHRHSFYGQPLQRALDDFIAAGAAVWLRRHELTLTSGDLKFWLSWRKRANGRFSEPCGPSLHH